MKRDGNVIAIPGFEADNRAMKSQSSRVQQIQKAFASMRVIYPVGPRLPRMRLIISVLALAGACLVALSSSNPSKINLNTSLEEVGVDSMEAPLVEMPSISPVQVEYTPVSTAVVPVNDATRSTFVELGALDSNTDESFNDFLIRVSQSMDAFTSKTGHEVCGVILMSDTAQAWRVRLTTNRSHLGCVMVSFDEPGFHRMGEDIHSHPRMVGGITINAQDVIRRPDFKCGGRAFVFDETFSAVDMKRGPGYLVSRNRLLYQNGSDKPFRQIAVFSSLDDPPSLSLSRTQKEAEADVLATAAEAAWANEDVDGIPQTYCGAVSAVSTLKLPTP